MTKSSTLLAVAAMAGTLGLSTIQPAKADTSSTVDTIIGAAAVIAGIAISQNVAHKQALANSVVGYTTWGATVYGDGHVVLPNGQSYYPSNVGQQVACNGTTCTITQNGVAVGYGGYGPGYGQYGYNNGYNNGYYAPANTGYYAPANTGYYAPAANTGTYAPNATHRVLFANQGNVAANAGTYATTNGRYYATATARSASVARDEKRARDAREDRAARDRDKN
jgi:hypothetical protein